MILLSPVALVLLAMIDVVTGKWRLPLLRLGLMAIVIALHEWYAVGLFLRIAPLRGATRTQAFERAMGTWSASLLRWCGRLLGVHVDWGDVTTLPVGRILMISRHASNVDAIIPAVLFGYLLQRPAHYVLKRELRWFPSFDLFGPPLGNYFVNRNGNTDSELDHLRGLSARVRDDGALVIFPEGTFATTATRARIRDSLERRGETQAVELTDELQSLLPPKPAGVLTLLRSRPDAHPMILAHRGLDGVAKLHGLRDNIPLREPVVIRWWSTVSPPEDPEAQVRWLQDEWRCLDRWVAAGAVDPPADRPMLRQRRQD